MDEKTELGDRGKRDIHWYVFLHDDGRANEIVAKALNTGPDHEDRLRRAVQCYDGKSRNLWRISHPEVRIVKNAGREFSFKATIFVQDGEGDPRVWVDPNTLRRKRMIMGKVRPAAK